jgi:hypothetical protein
VKTNLFTTISIVLLLLGSISSKGQGCASSTAYDQQTICQGTTYTFYGHILDTAGTYNDTIVLSGGCDSIISLQLFVIPTVYTYLNGQLCPGSGGYNFYGQTLTQTGVYYDTLFSSSFCDSVIVLTLSTSTSNPTKTVYGSICNGNPYYYYGNYYYYTGYYSVSIPNPTGCDTTVYLDINYYYNYTTYVTNYSCSSQPYYYNGRTFTVPGNYQDTLTSVGGCDSIVTLELFATNYNDVSIGTCASVYTYLGNTYSVPGIYNDTITNTGNCDSIISINLYKNTTGSLTYLYLYPCTTHYTYNGKVYDVPGYYYDTLTAVGGCDSLIYLDLYSEVAYSYKTVYSCNSQYVYNGTTYSVPGYYSDTLVTVSGTCDSIVYLDLYYGNPYSYVTYYGCTYVPYVYDGHSYTVPGYYYDTLTSVTGCDSFIYLELYSSNPYSYQTYYSCTNHPFIYNGNSYVVPGYYTVPLISPTGCDSTVYLDLYAGTLTSYQTYYVCNGQPFSFNGHSYPTPGYYVDTLISSGGCDSLIYLDLYDGSPYSYKTIYTCTSSYVYNGQTYSVPGYYNVTFITGASCDSTVYLDLYIGNPYSYKTVYTCLGQYTYGSSTYSVPGYYIDTLTTSAGCDSLVYLTFYSGDPYSYKTVYACSNQAYTYNSHSYTVPGTYADTLTGASGCDSIVYLQLYADNPYRFIIQYSCPSEPYIYRGHSYAVPGFYTDTISAATGCDSLIYIRLYDITVGYNYQYIYTCNNPYVFDGHYYSVPGFYYDTLKTAAGCDSSVESLYIYASSYDRATIYDNGCFGSVYTFRGKNYLIPGNYYYYYYDIYDTVPASNTCDTIFTIELSLGYAPYAYITDSFCQGGTYQYGSYTFSTPGLDTLYMSGPAGTCDTIVYLNLTYQAGPAIPTVSQSGDFLIAVDPSNLQYEWLLNGAPIGGNTQVLPITQNGTYNVIVSDSGTSCTARSGDVYVRSLGINSVANTISYQLSPNPNTGRFTLTVSDYSGVGVWIYDILGREIYQKQMSKGIEAIDLDAAEGTYLLMLKCNGAQSVSKFVITR